MGIMSIYKGDQGRAVRLFALISVWVLSLWAAVNLYHALAPGEIPPDKIWADWDLLGLKITISMYLIPSIVLFAAMAVAAWIVSHKPKVAEFLIETEGELKKISWPARKEWINSSLAVMVVIAIFIAYLYVVDFGLSALFIALKIGF